MAIRQREQFYDLAYAPQQANMLSDLWVVSQIPAATVNSIRTTLESSVDYIDFNRLNEIVHAQIENEDYAVSVASTLYNLRESLIPQLLEGLETWRKSDPKLKTRFTDEDSANLRVNLHTLIRDYPAIVRLKKAERLMEIIGNKLTHIDFICDLRPVFDSDRKKIEIVLPVTTMKLTFEKQDESTQILEVGISETLLDSILEKANTAKHKISLLAPIINLISRPTRDEIAPREK